LLISRLVTAFLTVAPASSTRQLNPPAQPATINLTPTSSKMVSPLPQHFYAAGYAAAADILYFTSNHSRLCCELL